MKDPEIYARGKRKGATADATPSKLPNGQMLPAEPDYVSSYSIMLGSVPATTFSSTSTSFVGITFFIDRRY
jgi:hypothetical protein